MDEQLISTATRSDGDIQCGITSRIESSLVCHVGLVRTENQDRVGHAASAYGEIFVLADGVGGNSGGAEAASMAVELYSSSLPAETSTSRESPARILELATQSIQKRIAELRSAEPAFHAMASTVVVVLLQAQTATIGHLGDSRVYLQRDGKFQAVTADHSVVQRMVEEGILSSVEARTHPSGHILTGSLGQTEAEIEITCLELHMEDLLLLCSDGLWTCVDDDHLQQELGADAAVTVIADRLLELALQAGAPDNVSIVLLRVCSNEVAISGNKEKITARSSEPRSRKNLKLLIAGVAVSIALASLLVILLLRRT